MPLSIADKETDAVRHCIFLTKPMVFFRSVELTFFVNSFISCGMASPHIIDANPNSVIFIHIAFKLLYYILNKEIKEFLIKIKMFFLRSLEIFISSREINLCRLDTFPTMVASRSFMYNRVPAFGLL